MVATNATNDPGGARDLCRKAIFWWLPVLYLLISNTFYLRTYDSAQVKITLVQMGGLCLLVLWLSRLIEEGFRVFRKEDLATLAPFLAYLGSHVLSFAHTPYKGPSLDEFLRNVFYMSVAVVVIYDFNREAVARLVRVLKWTAWITVGYGFLQWVDLTYYPPGIGQGIDPFVWRGAFGGRVFSTYGNPNFFGDFLVIIFPILLFQFLKDRSPALVVLMALDAFVLVRTETKGALLALGFTVFLCAFVDARYLGASLRRMVSAVLGDLPTRLLVRGAVVGLAIAIPSFVGYRLLYQTFTSVNFRMFTWLGTWEMIETRPVLGTGIGSFKVIYPAFRRPPIFHIEGKHNTETDHAEDEYLEVLFDQGILGFGIFLWLILSTSVIGFKALRALTGEISEARAPPPRAFDLAGFLVAFLGMLFHNFFDVSLRFVSSGVYVGLLTGIIVNLARGAPLCELHGPGTGPRPGGGPTPSGPRNLGVDDAGGGPWRTLGWVALLPVRLAALGGVLYMGYVILAKFAELQGPLDRITYRGEIFQWWISWGILASCVVWMGGTLALLALKTRRLGVCALVGAMAWPLNVFWGFFQADVHHNIAIFFSKQQAWDRALEQYFKVNTLNPHFIMPYYFKGNVYNDRFQMTRVNKKEWGDPPGVDRDDFERALAAYEEVRRLAPNYVQMHHQVGNLFVKRANHAVQQGKLPEANGYLEEALKRFKLYQAIDPVYAPNYFRMGQIHMMRRHYDEAIRVFKDLIDAPQCRVGGEGLARPFPRRTFFSYQGYVPDSPEPVHRHESPEAYTALANAYFAKGDAAEALKAYRRALVLDPSFQTASSNLKLLEERLKGVKAPPAGVQILSVEPGTAPKTEFKIETK